MLSISPVSSSLEWVPLLSEPSSWSSKLEWPKEVIGLLEVRAHSVDLVDEILEGTDIVLAETLFDKSVVSERDSLLVDFAIASLVDEFLDGFS